MLTCHLNNTYDVHLLCLYTTLHLIAINNSKSASSIMNAITYLQIVSQKSLIKIINTISQHYLKIY